MGALYGRHDPGRRLVRRGRSTTTMPEPATPADRFVAARPRLVRLAYSQLGDFGEAEDVVQEAWPRLERAQPHTIEDLDAWLTTVVARLALDALRSARLRRERYVGPWLPEPVLERSRRPSRRPTRRTA